MDAQAGVESATRRKTEDVGEQLLLSFGNTSPERASPSRRPLDPQRAKTFTAYDLRHHRLTQLAEEGNLLGTAHLAGHKRATTTDRYLRPSQQAGQRALGAVRATGFRPPPPPNLTRTRNPLAGVANAATAFSLCEGEDLNLHGSYPASTSIQNVLSPHPAEHPDRGPGLLGPRPETLLAVEAQALLDAAASHHPVDNDRLRLFARACLEMSETGRLALAVLDGGLFASRRALELAAHVRAAVSLTVEDTAHPVPKTGA